MLLFVLGVAGVLFALIALAYVPLAVWIEPNLPPGGRDDLAGSLRHLRGLDTICELGALGLGAWAIVLGRRLWKHTPGAPRAALRWCLAKIALEVLNAVLMYAQASAHFATRSDLPAAGQTWASLSMALWSAAIGLALPVLIALWLITPAARRTSPRATPATAPTRATPAGQSR
ncbi:MAG: hypothetical protein SFY69_12385 [Planctomycetota bacterium]|nr:hypothetical protein [Planctomycetota bacterium]